MINFLKFTWLYVLISAVVIGVGLFSIFRWGFRYSIDFVGGTNLEYQFNKTIKTADIKKVLKDIKIEVLEITVNQNKYLIRMASINEQKEIELKNILENKFKTKITVLKSETVGPILGKETLIKTLIASLLGVFGILIYMSFSFKNLYFALSAILAMVHDFLVVLGIYSLMSHFFGAQVDTMFVTAVLTTMSFSVHDTIVIFDKIREYFNLEGKGDLSYYANKALTETMVRSLNNSMTIVFMLSALVLMGGSTIKFFAATLLIGTISGTYSSPFVATPILVFMQKLRNK